MLPLFEMMLKAQNGAATDAMAKQFGIAQEQVAEAMAALMPAFSSGLKRTATNPYDLGPLMGAMLSGAYGKYFEDVGRAFTAQGKADGNIVLEQLFGSKEVSRAIAAQAEQFSGIGQDVLKRMMPAMADTIMGGLFKQATGQMGGNRMFPMADITRQWLQAMGMEGTAPQTGSGNAFDTGFDNPFTKAMLSMWGMDRAEKPQQAQTNPFGGNPFAKAFQDMMTGQSASKPAEAETSSTTASHNPMMDALNSMFDSGLEVQKSYQKNMETIFEQYLGPSPAIERP